MHLLSSGMSLPWWCYAKLCTEDCCSLPVDFGLRWVGRISGWFGEDFYIYIKARVEVERCPFRDWLWKRNKIKDWLCHCLYTSFCSDMRYCILDMSKNTKLYIYIYINFSFSKMFIFLTLKKYCISYSYWAGELKSLYSGTMTLEWKIKISVF